MLIPTLVIAQIERQIYEYIDALMIKKTAMIEEVKAMELDMIDKIEKNPEEWTNENLNIEITTPDSSYFTDKISVNFIAANEKSDISEKSSQTLTMTESCDNLSRTESINDSEIVAKGVSFDHFRGPFVEETIYKPIGRIGILFRQFEILFDLKIDDFDDIDDSNVDVLKINHWLRYGYHPICSTL